MGSLTFKSQNMPIQNKQEEIEATTRIPTDLFENARFHGERKQKLGSILKDHIPFATHVAPSEKRQVFVLRHGERVDYTFPDFHEHCFNNEGNYVPSDLNMPNELPKRDAFVQNWKKDTPITNLGLFQAELMGESVKNMGQSFDMVISSPAYRCVQTCDAFLKGMGVRDNTKICIDGGVHEWIKWSVLFGHGSLPDFFTPAEYSRIGFNIDQDYVPIMSTQALKDLQDESFTDVFIRNNDVVENALNNCGAKNILIVAHGSNLYSCTRKFVGIELKKLSELDKIFRKTSYCGLVAIEESNEPDKWNWITPPLSSLTHAQNNTGSDGSMPQKFKNTLKANFRKVFSST